MPCGVFTIEDVPSANLTATVALLQLDHPLKIGTTKQDNGKWTVVATFKPCTTPAEDKKPTLAFDQLVTHVTLDKLDL